MMRFYTRQHRFYCGVDLHARTLALCILDNEGQVLARPSVAASPTAVLDALAPFRDDLAVACECMFAWYWLADLCHEQNIPFVPGGNAPPNHPSFNDTLDPRSRGRGAVGPW
jgi:hypothetical protein